MEENISVIDAPEIPEEFPDPIPRRIVQLLAYHDESRHGAPAYATGFLVEHKGKRFLVSNYHVFTGQSPDRRYKGAPPRHPYVIEIWSFGVPVADVHVGADYLVHPDLRTLLCDIAAFPLEKCKEPAKGEPHLGDLRLYNKRASSLKHVEAIDMPDNPYRGYEGPERHTFVSDAFLPISCDTTIFGFPAGINFDTYPVGINTKMASEYYGKHPYFLVSGTGYSGCSGAPVVARSFGGYFALTPPDKERVKGSIRTWSRFYGYSYRDLGMPIVDQLIGIFSGRMIGPAEAPGADQGWGFVCQVWKWQLVLETVAYGVPDAEVG